MANESSTKSEKNFPATGTAADGQESFVKQADLGPLNTAIINLQNEIKELNVLSSNVQKGVKEHEKKITKFKAEMDTINSDLKRAQDKEIRIIETLAIFVALFTFISINIQIFSRVSDLTSAIVLGHTQYMVLA